jgi:predicted secreted protein
MPFLQIILLCITAAVGYGIIHDQVTARVCVEYFTIGHPPIFATADPTLLGVGWGIIATWWVGLFLGIPLAIAARFGKRPKRSPASIVRSLLTLLATAAICAFVAGCVGFFLAHQKIATFSDSIPSGVPSDHHAGFIADAFAHGASYLVGFVGGLILIVKVWLSRGSDTSAPSMK